VLYDVAGPLFFGAVQKAMSALDAVGAGVRTVLLDLRDVPAMDATGLVGLESALDRLRHSGVLVILGGVQPQPAALLARAGITSEDGARVICESFDEAVDMARILAPPPAPAAAAARARR
jgi:SulP family sulfate permease